MPASLPHLKNFLLFLMRPVFGDPAGILNIQE